MEGKTSGKKNRLKSQEKRLPARSRGQLKGHQNKTSKQLRINPKKKKKNGKTGASLRGEKFKKKLSRPKEKEGPKTEKSRNPVT